MCGCSKKTVVVNTPMSVSTVYIPEPDCTVTKEELLLKKDMLINKKTPENTMFINQQLGNITTMLNSGHYCRFQIHVI
jgi:hypothetical protein